MATHEGDKASGVGVPESGSASRGSGSHSGASELRSDSKELDSRAEPGEGKKKRKKKRRRSRPPDTCPEPSGLSEKCDDPKNRQTKEQERKKSFVVEVFRRLAGKKRQVPPSICDCRSKTDLPTEKQQDTGRRVLSPPPPAEGLSIGFGEHRLDDSVAPALEAIPMETLGIQEVIRKKRNGEELSPDEIRWFCEEVASGRVHESQLGAILMAICIQGMSDNETMELTKGIIETGEQLRWDENWSPVVDKHSTGGVGDKVSIILAPALAALDLKVPMLSGRGLGFTGGTLDKLESIPNFKVQCTNEELYNAVDDVGCFIAGATNSIAPVDKVLYSIRDITATIDCQSLITSSIISKKVASGSQVLVMDIKVGSAAFFRKIQEARQLGENIIKVSKPLGVSVRVMLTEMDTPIGRAVGNALEVEEAVECLKGAGPSDLMELVCTAGGLILETVNRVSSLEEGKQAINQVIQDGSALQRFHDMCLAQGVAHEDVENLCAGSYSQVLPSVPQDQITPMRVKKKGTITKIDAFDVGSVAWRLGAGRVIKDQLIDYRVGIWFTHLVGDFVEVGDVWAEVHHAGENFPEDLEKQLEEAITIEPGKVDVTLSRILDII